MILDTNALSSFVDGDAGLSRALARALRLAVPVIVLGEFLYGITGSRHRTRYAGWLHAHLRDFDILDVTDATAAVYADVRVALKRSGTPIPANDVWIAALALEHRLPVVSRDAHFDVVPGVERRDW